MMNRRNLFARLLAGAGAAAFVVAPAGTAEAGPVPATEQALADKFCDGFILGREEGEARMAEAVAQARAEGYERGRAIEQAKAESRQAEPWHYTGVQAVEIGGTEPVSRAYGESFWIRRQGVPRPAGNLRALEVHADGDALTAAAGALGDLGLIEPIADTLEVRITS